MAKMAEQMELFEPVTRGFQEGGLKDEGGKTDPVSGNEVPPGSLREEVRDDIPAQLSEGEFVFPADVVRYIGLENLMRMRQEAKQGLAQMEAMGQMGNSEEATMPDDLPFDMYDLEVEDDGLEMQTGGMVPAPMSTAMGATTTGGSYNPATNQFQPFAGMGSTQPQPLGTAFAAPAAASTAYSPRLGGTLFTPTTPEVQYQQPTLYGTTGFGPEGVEFEDITYVNEQGQILNFKRNKQTGQLFDLSGNPAVVPEGYTEQAKEEEKVETIPTTDVGTQTTRVRDDGGREDIDTQEYGGPPGTFGNRATRQGLAMFSQEFDEAVNPFTKPLSKVNIVSAVVSAVNPVLGLVTRGLITKEIFDKEISRLAEDYSFFTEESLRAELGNLATSSKDYANAQKAIENAINKQDKAARAKAQRDADNARAAFGDSAARAAGVTETQGIAGIEASGVAPGPGAPLGASKQGEDRDVDRGIGGGDASADTSAADDSYGDEFGGSVFKSGGLVKQMKRSGLASKK